MRAVDVIIKKRGGSALSREEIDFFVQGATSGAVPDYQTSALLMAILLRGMTPEETASLTDAMVRSGVRLDLRDIPGVKVDKHSTGGVGDKTSLILAPIAAACGVPVPMMSGRGLGHTGGTLDKLEAIPGFRVNLSLDEMRSVVARVGCVMIGQTKEIAPADKRLYALRDVTGTVESIPLISASIMSKKIAEGIDALVLDVKTGSGAFMKTAADSRRLAESLVAIGNASGVKTEAVITLMETPLGLAVGNALEVIECFDVLKGQGPADLIEVSIDLTARMLVLGRVADDLADAERQAREAITSGAAIDKFRQIIDAQGGDPRAADDYGRMPSVAGRELVTAERAGYLTRLDAELVGIMITAKPGDQLRAGDPILELHYRDRARLDAARSLARQAVTIGDERPPAARLIIGEVR